MSRMRKDWTETIRYRRKSSAFTPWGDQPWEIQSFANSEEMASVNHFPLDTTADDGGPWLLHKSYDRPIAGWNPGHRFHQGEFTTGLPVGYVQSVPTQRSNSELDSFGTTAIARSEPTNPAFDMTVALGELAREGLPTVVGAQSVRNRAKVARSAGGEYLNVQFGWLPLLSEVQSFAKAVKESDKILSQYRKDSGMKIRRGYDRASTGPMVTVSQHGNFLPVPAAFDQWGSGSLVVKRTEKQWFRGAFRYHIPTSDSQLGKFREWASMADKLLGVKVTPEDVWNLAPWSWAADWFTNTGDVMHNISALGRDGLVLQYGYSMAHTEIETSAYVRFASGSASRQWFKSYKQRRPATPYGFGVDLTTLSAKQISIIAALGLSRT